jgi:hypothetical protein
MQYNIRKIADYWKVWSFMFEFSNRFTSKGIDQKIICWLGITIRFYKTRIQNKK